MRVTLITGECSKQLCIHASPEPAAQAAGVMFTLMFTLRSGSISALTVTAFLARVCHLGATQDPWPITWPCTVGGAVPAARASFTALSGPQHGQQMQQVMHRVTLDRM